MRQTVIFALFFLVACTGTGREPFISTEGNPQMGLDAGSQGPNSPVEDAVDQPDQSAPLVDIGPGPKDIAMPKDASPIEPDGAGGETHPYYDIGPVDTTPTPQSTDCKDIFACFEECGYDQECYTDCVYEASPEGQAVYESLVMCLDAAGYNDCPDWDQQCQNDALWSCETEYYACFSGDLSCLEMYLCYISCPQGGPGAQECPGECFADATVEAQQLWGTIIECLEETGYMDCPPDDEACQVETWAPCQPLYQECAHGELSCDEMTYCMNSCMAQDEFCYYECYFNGSIDAQNTYSELTACIQQECGDWDPTCSEAAIAGACAQPYADCYL